MTSTDPTAIPGQVDLEPGTPDPIAQAEGTARTARLARGTRPLSDAERRRRQEAMCGTVPDKEAATTGCTQSLHLSVFFDGTGNNRDEELAKGEEERALSNIARLFISHKDDTRNIKRQYLAGVGTPCPEVGDSGGLLGLSIGKGGRERIDFALQALDELIDSQPEPMRILVVSVSVLGFSRGAASARAFARDLAARCRRQADGTWLYRERIPLRIGFMGVFDTVCSVWPSLAAAAVNYRNGHTGWAEGMAVPEIVEQSVHMTAAHELRGQFPLDSTREHALYPANTVEIWFPGVHSDVGGGYDPQHQGRQNSIARFALNEMYDMAQAGGVLLHPVSELEPFLKAEFDKQDPELQAVFNAYLQAVRVKRGCMEDVQASHMELLYRWLRVRVARGDRLPSMQRLAAREDALREQVRTLRRRQSQLPSPWGNDNLHLADQGNADKTAEWNRVSDELKARDDELSAVRKQRRGLEKENDTMLGKIVSLRRRRERGATLTMAERVTLESWDNTTLLPPEVEAFFDGYGHDSVAHWFIGNLSQWRVLYFGATKYTPGKVEEKAEASEAVPG